MTIKTLQNKARKLKDLEDQKKALDSQIEALKSDIKSEMEQREAEEITAGDCIIRWTQVASNRFNSKQFQAEHPRLYKKFLTETQSRRFSII